MDATLGGYPWLPRMIDKARAARAGTLGSYVHPCPVDRTCLASMWLDFDAFSAVIARTRTDAEVLGELRPLGIAPPAQAWFDPVAREEELQRGAPAAEVVRGDLAGLEHGLVGVSLRRATLAPGAATPRRRHPYDTLVIVEDGRAAAEAGAAGHDLGPGDTLTVPARLPYRLANAGDAPLRLIAVHANGRVLELPVGDGEPGAEGDEGAAERAPQPREHARA